MRLRYRRRLQAPDLREWKRVIDKSALIVLPWELAPRRYGARACTPQRKRAVQAFHCPKSQHNQRFSHFGPLALRHFLVARERGFFMC
jgi:hypothetical protein